MSGIMFTSSDLVKIIESLKSSDVKYFEYRGLVVELDKNKNVQHVLEIDQDDSQSPIVQLTDDESDGSIEEFDRTIINESELEILSVTDPLAFEEMVTKMDKIGH